MSDGEPACVLVTVTSPEATSRIPARCRQRLRCLAPCPDPGVLADTAACAPCPVDSEKSQAAEAFESTTKERSWPALSFTALLSSVSFVAQELQSATLRSISQAGIGPDRQWDYRQSPTVPGTVREEGPTCLRGLWFCLYGI